MNNVRFCSLKVKHAWLGDEVGLFLYCFTLTLFVLFNIIFVDNYNFNLIIINVILT